MKVRAYIFDKQANNYKTDRFGSLVEIHAEEAAELKMNYPHEHNRREYRNTRANPERRQRLKLVTKNGTSFFSYIGEREEALNERIDESESHYAAIVALSRLKIMKFCSSGFELPLEAFHFSEVKVEPRLELANGNVYYPDLLCIFNEDHPLYDRWGGKLAIEVTYAHPCEVTKIHDFMFHNIPILELVIEKNSSREYPGERYKWDYYSLTSIKKHIDNLEDWFQEYIWINVLVDPISNRVHERITTSLSNEIKMLSVQKEFVEEAFTQSKKDNKILQDKVESSTSKSLDLIGELNIMTAQLQGKNRLEKIKNDELEKLKERMKQKSSQVSRLLVYSTLLTTLIVGSLVAPIFFMQAVIDVLTWYLSLLS
ncbi:hypothetical protein [Aeromonas caviae]